MRPGTLRGFALAALLAAAAAGCGRDELAPLPGWGSDYEKAREQAAGEKKPLAVLFSAAWSDAARKFESGTLSDRRVADKLSGFVRVRLDLDASQKAATALEARDRNGNFGVPWLVLVSPEGERKSVAGLCSADDLAGFLDTLGTWGPLPGWESDPARAESAAKESGKPLAVLFSSAWDPAAAAFENGALADERVVKALSGYTLLRVNLAASPELAKREGREAGRERKIQTAPTLVLPAAQGDRRIIPGKCPPEALLAAVACLSGWKALPGWPADYAAAVAQARAEKKPLAVVLDSADWPSAEFLGRVVESETVSKALGSFVRIRLEFGGLPEETRKALGHPASGPCLVVLDPSSGKKLDEYRMKSDSAEAARKAAEKIAEGLKSAERKAGKETPAP